ncbi:hypothetical protein EMCRGX_G014952 [Ephydatia muelleri]
MLDYAVKPNGSTTKKKPLLPCSRLASLLAIGQAIPKPKMLGDIYGHLSMSLVRSVARAIMGRENVRIDSSL